MSPIQFAQTKRGVADRPPHCADDWGHDEHTPKTPFHARRLAHAAGNSPATVHGHTAWMTHEGAPLSKDAIIHGMMDRLIGGLQSSTITIQHQDEQAPSSPPADLEEALQELASVTADAEEEGIDVPSQTARTNAERLLKAMYRISPRLYGVYPAPDGYVAIDARGINDRIAVVMCGSAGEALCFATIDGDSRRARYSTARELPDGFIREALAALGPEPAR